MKVGQRILDFCSLVSLNEQGIVHRQKGPEQREKITGLEMLHISIVILYIGKILVPQQIGFGGLIGIKIPDVFFCAFYQYNLLKK
jgi:hypothetical protein